MNDYREFLPAAIEAIDIAAELMRTLQPGVLTAKGDRDMASEADFAIEQQIRDYLQMRTPGIGFLGEEGGTSGTNQDLIWALDPIDGTVNFIRGHPLCAVSLGLVQNGRPVVGVIDLPFLGRRYSAAESHGAFANGRPVNISPPPSLHDAVVAVGDYAVGKDAEHKNQLRLEITTRLAQRAQRLRMHGSAAIDLAWLADGKIDAVILCSNNPWDTSAGVVIAREAGALVFDKDGSAHSTQSSATIAAGASLVSEALALVQSAEQASPEH